MIRRELPLLLLPVTEMLKNLSVGQRIPLQEITSSNATIKFPFFCKAFTNGVPKANLGFN
ncbi:hypothetical protein HMPREF3198_00270 [Winkia neuii]|uniref:Uncharacterized protein n=1 Tax=Winkia neuii TaxID=33007 RepID=A0A2I1IMI9_9ACTO|nr:hypothetical protein HMPREF3198_00270 [Winkia neuii]OFK00137.1 hypothetical protein HMPREF2835_03460 [Actinomyces sp. HMSC072A03]PKY72337.1 hypothetical protein CYJ19_05680 [Winkia neuii]